MLKSDNAVASEGLSGGGRGNDVVVVDGRIADNWSVRERKWVSKML